MAAICTIGGLATKANLDVLRFHPRKLRNWQKKPEQENIIHLFAIARVLRHRGNLFKMCKERKPTYRLAPSGEKEKRKCKKDKENTGKMVFKCAADISGRWHLGSGNMA